MKWGGPADELWAEVTGAKASWGDATKADEVVFNVVGAEVRTGAEALWADATGADNVVWAKAPKHHKMAKMQRMLQWKLRWLNLKNYTSGYPASSGL